jgi:hypothetical protein
MGAQALAKALESNTTLTTLNLWSAYLIACSRSVCISVWLCVLVERVWLSQRRAE